MLQFFIFNNLWLFEGEGGILINALGHCVICFNHVPGLSFWCRLVPDVQTRLFQNCSDFLRCFFFFLLASNMEVLFVSLVNRLHPVGNLLLLLWIFFFIVVWNNDISTSQRVVLHCTDAVESTWKEACDHAPRVHSTISFIPWTAIHFFFSLNTPNGFIKRTCLIGEEIIDF